jgi:argininosuccinate lyase
VLVDVHLYLKDVIKDLKSRSKPYLTMMESAEKHQNVLLPGYTHLQIAMPSSFGMWFPLMPKALLTISP